MITIIRPSGQERAIPGGTWSGDVTKLLPTAPSFRHSVHIVGDDEDSLNSLGALLGAFGYRTRPWSDARSFLRAARSLAPACVLVAFDRPGRTGLQLQQDLRERNIALPLIFITRAIDVSSAVRAMRAGAVHLLEMPVDAEELCGTINEAGERLGDSGSLSEGERARRTIASLTSREEEVLKGLCAGFPNKSIAFDLGLSPRTIEVHRANIMRKLNVRSLAGALRIAFEAGF